MIYTDCNDETLVSITLLGDEKAYETLVIRYEKVVIGAAYSVTGNHYMAEDAAQDAFVSAWMKLDMLKEHAKFRAWVCRIAKNCAKNLAIRYRDYICFDLVENTDFEQNMLYEESFLSDNEDTALHDSVNGLSEKVRQVIKLHYIEGLSIADIADKLKLPVGTVKRRLHDGRQQIRKDLGYMEKKTDTLVEAVMLKVEQLIRWQMRESKDSFAEAYADVLQDIVNLPESIDKYNAMADVLLRGYWWLPGEKNDELIEKLRDAAEKGNNLEVLAYLIRREENKLSGDDKIIFMREKQIPRFEEAGMTKALGEEWFWLGWEYIKKNDYKASFEAFKKVTEVLKQEDKYYANALSAIRVLELAGDCEEKKYRYRALGEQYRKEGSKLYFWSQPGFSYGYLPGALDADPINYYASKCDGLFYDENMQPGDTVQSAGGRVTLTFADTAVTVEAVCGTFTGCELWITETYNKMIHTYYKRGIGIIRQEHNNKPNGTYCFTLKNYHIEGGTDLIPFAAGNYWEYDAGLDSSIYKYESIYKVTSFNGIDAVLSVYSFCRRFSYSTHSWEDMMLQMRSEYCTKGNDQILVDTSALMTRAEELAKTDWQKTHTKVAVSVMKRIFDTSPDFNKNYTARGHWNFFELCHVSLTDGKVAIEGDRTWSFEWKDMGDTGDAGHPLLYNDIYDILSNVAGCLWCDDWKIGVVLSVKGSSYMKDLTTELRVEAAGTIDTAAGRFENCILISLDTKGEMRKGLRYRTGRKDYYFAPQIGIVRTVNYFKNNSLKAVYELTSYIGTGEGYMPVEAGMIRHYDAIGLTDGYLGAAEYTYCNNDNGEIKILQDRTGIRKLK